jgi:translation initiation factor IF-2
MKDYKGESLTQAGPSCPVRILGFKVAPQVGDILDVGSASSANVINIKEKRNIQSGAEKKTVSITADPEEEEQKKVLNLVIKADTLGSLEAIIGSLDKIKNEEVGVRIVGKGLGNVQADDVAKAETTHGIICGFNVVPVPLAKNMIQDKNIQFLQFSVIYDLIDFVKVELKKLLNPEKIITELGSLKVAAIFRTAKGSMIVGGRVVSGKLKKEARVRVKRDGELIGQGKIGQLQSGQQTVNELPEGNEGGLQFDGKIKLEIGDILEAYKEEEKEKKLVLE